MLLRVEAPTRGLLTAERTLLNLVCHLSGIATATAAWVDAVEGTGAKIRDTRKTLPGLRLQKYAVRVGGGSITASVSGDAALIRDNHVAAAGSVVAALRAVRTAAPDLPCEVEVDTPRATRRGPGRGRPAGTAGQLPGGRPRSRSSAATLVLRQPNSESSGGLSPGKRRGYAGTGVDYLAVGRSPLGAGSRRRSGYVVGLDM